MEKYLRRSVAGRAAASPRFGSASQSSQAVAASLAPKAAPTATKESLSQSRPLAAASSGSETAEAASSSTFSGSASSRVTQMRQMMEQRVKTAEDDSKRAQLRSSSLEHRRESSSIVVEPVIVYGSAVGAPEREEPKMEPKKEEPKKEEPKKEELKKEQPKKEEPKKEEPNMSQPTASAANEASAPVSSQAAVPLSTIPAPSAASSHADNFVKPLTDAVASSDTPVQALPATTSSSSESESSTNELPARSSLRSKLLAAMNQEKASISKSSETLSSDDTDPANNPSDARLPSTTSTEMPDVDVVLRTDSGGDIPQQRSGSLKGSGSHKGSGSYRGAASVRAKSNPELAVVPPAQEASRSARDSGRSRDSYDDDSISRLKNNAGCVDTIPSKAEDNNKESKESKESKLIEDSMMFKKLVDVEDKKKRKKRKDKETYDRKKEEKKEKKEKMEEKMEKKEEKMEEKMEKKKKKKKKMEKKEEKKKAKKKEKMEGEKERGEKKEKKKKKKEEGEEQKEGKKKAEEKKKEEKKEKRKGKEKKVKKKENKVKKVKVKEVSEEQVEQEVQKDDKKKDDKKDDKDDKMKDDKQKVNRRDSSSGGAIAAETSTVASSVVTSAPASSASKEPAMATGGAQKSTSPAGRRSEGASRASVRAQQALQLRLMERKNSNSDEAIASSVALAPAAEVASRSAVPSLMLSPQPSRVAALRLSSSSPVTGSGLAAGGGSQDSILTPRSRERLTLQAEVDALRKESTKPDASGLPLGRSYSTSPSPAPTVVEPVNDSPSTGGWVPLLGHLRDLTSKYGRTPRSSELSVPDAAEPDFSRSYRLHHDSESSHLVLTVAQYVDSSDQERRVEVEESHARLQSHILVLTKDIFAHFRFLDSKYDNSVSQSLAVAADEIALGLLRLAAKRSRAHDDESAEFFEERAEALVKHITRLIFAARSRDDGVTTEERLAGSAEFAIQRKILKGLFGETAVRVSEIDVDYQTWSARRSAAAAAAAGAALNPLEKHLQLAKSCAELAPRLLSHAEVDRAAIDATVLDMQNASVGVASFFSNRMLSRDLVRAFREFRGSCQTALESWQLRSPAHTRTLQDLSRWNAVLRAIDEISSHD
jgi:hypothetical protein